MRSRGRRARAIAWLLAAGIALTGPAAAQSIDGFPDSRFVEVREPLSPEYPVARFMIASEASAQTERVVNTTHAALALLSDWFGAAPPTITVAGVPWRGSFTGTVRPGMVTAPLRWLTPVRDQSTERALIGGLVRWYWTGGNPAASPFDEALIVYAGTRAVHQLLEGSNFATLTFFGGFVPLPLRSVLLSPPVADPRPRAWRFDEREGADDAGLRRGVRALQTIERYVGWPTLLEALSRLRLADRRDAATFASLLSEVRGTDLRLLVAECLGPDAGFDYSLDGLQSSPGSSELIESTVTINRRGSGRFAIGNGEATIPVVVRFADGTEIRDYFDGAAPSTALVYSAKAAANSAMIDPDVMLVLDANRENNSIQPQPRLAPLGVRLALHWMTWLQSAMLSYTALL